MADYKPRVDKPIEKKVSLTKINIEFIPHDQQRYETVGDYYFDEAGVLQIRISQMKVEIHEMAVLIHELTEMAILRHEGKVSFEDVDKFDFEFEEKRERGEVGEEDEPGMAIGCPYRDQHLVATSVEMAVIAAAKVSWKEYENEIYGL